MTIVNYRQCPECNGEGYTESVPFCPYCHGTGKQIWDTPISTNKRVLPKGEVDITPFMYDTGPNGEPVVREPEPTRSQKMREAGFTRRPSWKSLPSDNMDDEPAPDASTVDQIMVLFLDNYIWAEQRAALRAAVERVVQERDDFRAGLRAAIEREKKAEAERDDTSMVLTWFEEENVRLLAERDALQQKERLHYDERCVLQGRINVLEEERSTVTTPSPDSKDAARYRFLRDRGDESINGVQVQITKYGKIDTDDVEHCGLLYSAADDIVDAQMAAMEQK